MLHRRRFRPAAFAALALAPIVLAGPVSAPALAAAGTTCLCRTEDNKGFVENTVRHHRWACDFHFGYLRGDPPNQKGNRPVTQTCTDDEIIQWKVYRCVSAGCTYAYVTTSEKPNEKLKKIEKAPAKRNP